MKKIIDGKMYDTEMGGPMWQSILVQMSWRSFLEKEKNNSYLADPTGLYSGTIILIGENHENDVGLLIK